VYALLVLASYALLYLPGDPSPEGGQGFWILVDAVLVIGLVRGSFAAWVVSLCFALLGAFAIAFAWSLDSPGLMVYWLLIVAQVVVLVSRPLRVHVWRRAPRPA